jgi:hypothetical protein
MPPEHNPLHDIEQIERHFFDEGAVNRQLSKGWRLLGVATGTSDEGSASVHYVIGRPSPEALDRQSMRLDYAEANSELEKMSLERDGYEVAAVHPRSTCGSDGHPLCWTVYVMRRWEARSER